MHIIGYLFAILIGIVMGLIGGGGSILSVPVFAYLFEIDAITATALSLFVVGVTSSVGSVSFIRQGHVRFQTALQFGLPSVLGILFSRRVVLPHLPPYIINRWGITVTNEMFILLLFAILMIIAAIKMIQKKQRVPPATQPGGHLTLLASQGLLVGIITGFIGAGGGFLIVPALVMLMGVKMKEAVGTSLFIISVNSLIGFISSLDKVAIDWGFLLLFTSLSIIGILVGVAFSKRIESRKLKPLFGYLVLTMGILIIISEILIK